ncbi:MAG: rRNA adenine N-6-methyltransferase family protein [Pseudonocardiaceae bacterium]
MIDDEIVQLADTAKDQYFLTSPEKLSLLIKAAGIRETDYVVEIGAGIGTVARALPSCASLTLIELDSRFIDIMCANVPYARVVQGDGLALLQDIRCDVLLSNLPTSLTESLVELLPTIPFRTAVITMNTDGLPLDRLKSHFLYEIVVTIGGGDFEPTQPVQSMLVKVTRPEPEEFVS